MVSFAIWSLLLLAGLSAAEVSGDKGTPVDLEDYPSIVQIENRVGLLWVQAGVGSVLTSRHVLTVALSVSGPVADNFPSYSRRVRAGASRRGRDGVIATVEHVYKHPSFGGEDGFFDGNLAVIRLLNSLTFSPTIQQAKIIGDGYGFPTNVPVNVVTWGRTAQSGVWADRELRSVDLLVSGHQECVEKYASLPVPVTISPNKICIGTGKAGTNLGVRDAGAPVYYTKDVIVGLVAFGSPYGESFPLVATSISPYTKWIIETAKY